MPHIAKRHVIIALIIFMQTAFGIFGGVVAASTSGNNKVFPGVFINGIDVGNLTPAEAEAKLRQKLEALSETTLVLRHENKKWHLPYSDLEVKLNYRQSAWSAYELGRETNPVARVISSFKLRRHRADIDLEITFNESKADGFLTVLARELNHPGRDARVSWQNGRLVVTPEQNGMELDIPAARQQIIEAVKALTAGPVDLAVKQKIPRVMARELASIKDELASFTTTFDPGKTNRAHNIRLAAEFLNNSIVKPGEIFSFNKQVGPRMAKYGYKEAPVIANNRLQPGIGGGVCQVSTTLYQALLHAGMSAKERTPHSKPPGYVPLGQDAAVADNQIDFTFENTGQYPVLITAAVAGNKLTVRILGKKEHNYVVRLTSENIRKITPAQVTVADPSLPRGKKIFTKGDYGYRVKVFRTITENGKVVKKELLSDDYYRPTDAVVRVGTR
ncbi:MAG: VanW family protein [Bacillota bacterium]